LDVPVAAEVAVAFQSVNVLNALVAEVCNVNVRVGGAEVCQDWYGARRLVDDDCLADQPAVGSYAAFVAGFGGVFEHAAHLDGHAFLVGVGSEVLGAESSILWVVL
jgi:hypothetical protein